MPGTLDFYKRTLRIAARDTNFRQHLLAEVWQVLRQRLPARLVTPRRDYVFCPYLAGRNLRPVPGRWLPPQSLPYRLSAYGMLFDEAGRLLMVSGESLNFGWNLPGGGVNKGETLAEGLRREFEEETGLLVTVGPVVYNTDSFCIMPTGQAIHAVLHFYLVEVVGGQLLPHGNGFDTTRAAFVDFATLPETDVNDAPLMQTLLPKGRALLELSRQSR